MLNITKTKSNTLGMFHLEVESGGKMYAELASTQSGWVSIRLLDAATAVGFVIDIIV